MKNQLLKWEVFSFIFSVGMGTFLHFLYDWSGNNKIVGLFSAVNESTWEHLKLLFVPYALFAIAEYFFIGREYSSFLTVKAVGILIGMATVVVLFYTYSGVLGNNYAIINILIFFIGGFLATLYSYRYMELMTGGNILGITVFAVLSVCFVMFTYSPPETGLFIDPTTKQGQGF